MKNMDSQKFGNFPLQKKADTNSSITAYNKNNMSGKHSSTQKYIILREKMVHEQIEARGITNKKVIDLMLTLPREDFISRDMDDLAYDDRPLSIGFGQTISQPYIVALMTELLELSGNEKTLEIGTGSGYQTAILSMASKEVFSIEIVRPLYEITKNTLAGYKNIRLALRDGYFGWAEFAPFDRIIVTAAPENIPEPLVLQLKEGGIMVIPMGPSGRGQSLIKARKEKGLLVTEKICDVSFVPLTRNKGHEVL
jgi:protein-L-isoaspartate(D-aspartate) O-methyltransferase